MIFRNLWVRIRSEGLARTLGQIKSILVPTVFGIWVRNIDSGPLSSENNAHLETQTGPSAIQELAGLRMQRAKLPVEYYRDLGEKVQTCVLAKKDGRLAAIAWGYDHERPGHFLQMRRGDVEVRSVHTLPEFRNRGIAKCVVMEACNWFWEYGADQIYAVIHRDNQPSVRVFEALGFVKIWELRRPALFGPRYISAARRAQSWREVLLGPFRRPPAEHLSCLPRKNRAKQIQIRLCDDLQEWRKAVSEFGGSLYQSWMWGELRRTQGWIPWRVLLEERGKMQAAAQILERRIAHLPWAIMYAPCGVLTAQNGSDVYGELAEFFKQFLRERRAIMLRTDPRISESDALGKEYLKHAGFRLIPDESTPWWNLPRTNMIVDISGTEDDLLRRMRQKHREHIRRANRNGLIFERGTTIAQLEDFYRLLVKTGRRQEFPVRSFNHFLRLHEILLNGLDGLIFLARFKGQAVAAIVCVRFDSTCFYLYGGFDWDYRHLHPNEALQWEAIKWAKGRGCSAYNMLAAGTAYPPREGNHGYSLFHFKKGFGAELNFSAGYFDLVNEELGYVVFRFLEKNAAGVAFQSYVSLRGAARRAIGFFHKRRSGGDLEVPAQD